MMGEFLLGIAIGISAGALAVMAGSDKYIMNNQTYSGEPIHEVIAQCESNLPRSQRCVVTAVVEEG